VFVIKQNNTFPSARGMASFTVEIKENGGSGDSRIADNNGRGFPVGDAVTFQLEDSCIHIESGIRNITIAVSYLLICDNEVF
jgi:hypothetical protein